MHVECTLVCTLRPSGSNIFRNAFLVPLYLFVSSFCFTSHPETSFTFRSMNASIPLCVRRLQFRTHTSLTPAVVNRRQRVMLFQTRTSGLSLTSAKIHVNVYIGGFWFRSSVLPCVLHHHSSECFGDAFVPRRIF